MRTRLPSGGRRIGHETAVTWVVLQVVELRYGLYGSLEDRLLGNILDAPSM